MITQYEYDDLKAKLNSKNNGQILTDNNLSFDSGEVKIVPIDEVHTYEGRINSLDIMPRLLYKAHRYNAFETHLQAFVMQKFDDVIFRNKILTLDNNSAWIGNEVSCGVGMQRIDTMIIEENESEIHLKIVEMKDEEPYSYILDEQLPWYLKWTSQYIIPNLQKRKKSIIIHPCILAKRTENQDMIDRIRNEKMHVPDMQNVSIASTEYIGFDITDTEIIFEKII